MEPRWLALLGCVCAFVALGQAAAVPASTQDTLVVARSAEEGDVTSAVSVEPTTEGPLPNIKMLEMSVRSEVSLRYAYTAVVTKVRNPARRAQEATFSVLLPETAFISGFVMILEGKSYKAYVKEKEEAKQIFADAVSAGIGAAHIAVKARDSNHFRVSVNVEANATAVFNLTYEELLVRRNNVYNHAINLHPGALVPKLTVTVHIKEAQKITQLRVPEIRTGNEIDATEDDAQNSNALIERGHDDREATITFTPDLAEQQRLMDIYAAKAKESKTHVNHYWQAGEEESKPEGVLGQFVVQYDVERPKEGEILVNDGYFVHFFAPSDLPPLHKHVVFVLDTSGSMMDRKITQLREAMQTILSELNPGDYFSIVEFATSVTVHDLKEAEQEPPKMNYGYNWNEVPATLVPPARATPENIARAKTIVSRLNANGGTNIASALNVAVDLINKGVGWTPAATTPASKGTTPGGEGSEDTTPSNDAPHAEPLLDPTGETPLPTTETSVDKDVLKLEAIIIFLTDGDPTVGETDPTRIVNRLVEKNSGPNKAAIFSLAFGEDADRNLLRKLSLRNDGFMRHIYEAADAALQLRDFYRQVSSPLLADVRFNYPKEQIKEGSLTKNKFPAYYAGSETVVAGRVADDAAEITPAIVGWCGADDEFFKRKKYEIFPKVPVKRAAGQYLPLERLWAYLTIKQLLDEKDAEDKPAAKDKEDTPEKKALQIALKYEFVTPLTSLVVVKPNATNAAVNAESVDKQSSSGGYGVPLLASGAGGAAGPPGYGLPQAQFAYKAAFSSAVGYEEARPVSDSYPHPAPQLDIPVAEMIEESEDYDGEHNDIPDSTRRHSISGRRGRTRSRTKSKAMFFSAEPYADGASESMSPLHSFHSSAIGLTGLANRGGMMSYDNVDDLIDIRITGSPSKFSGYKRGGAVYYPSTTFAQPAPTVLPTLPSSSQSPLEAASLQEFPWVKDVLSPTGDAISFDASVNGTTTHVQLQLEQNNAPKEASDAECARSTTGAAGVCVYLTRCGAAKAITLDQYKQTYCYVNNRFAGVCCPREKVDAELPKKP